MTDISFGLMTLSILSNIYFFGCMYLEAKRKKERTITEEYYEVEKELERLEKRKAEIKEIKDFLYR
jgi:hypothetical protein